MMAVLKIKEGGLNWAGSKNRNKLNLFN